MSIKDANIEINTSYKRYDGSWIGHNLFLLAENNQGNERLYRSVYDLYGQCGPLVIVNEESQRWAEPCTVSFEYEKCERSVDADYNFRGTTVSKPTYIKAAGTFSGEVTIPKGTDEYHQLNFNGDYVHIITSLTISDPLQSVKVYCLADDGMRLLEGMNVAEDNRLMLDKIERSQWVSPPKCQLCGGTGEYPEGTVCPDCDGYKYYGKNAQKYFLTEKAKQFGIRKRDESDESFQWRAWAINWWLIPTRQRIKEFISHFTKIDIERITIEEHYFPEAYWIVRLPIFSVGQETIGDLLSIEDGTLEEIFSNITPAGINVLILETYESGDFDAFGEKGLTQVDKIEHAARGQWQMQWDDNFFLDGVEQGWKATADNPVQSTYDPTKLFYDGVTLQDYIQYRLYDQSWPVSGTRGLGRWSDATIV